MDASAWVAVVAALIASIAVVVTFWQAKSAKTQAEAARRQADAASRQTELQEQIYRDSHQPYVWADFRADPANWPMVKLIVRNEGPTVAEDVRVTFDPPLQSPDGDVRFAERAKSLLASALTSLPPGRHMSWNYGRGFVLFADNHKPLQHKVTITGRGPFGVLPTLEYVINLEDLVGTAPTRDGSLHQIAESVDGLGKSIDQAAANLRPHGNEAKH